MAPQFIVLLLLLEAQAPATGGLVIIVSPRQSITDITLSDLRSIYLGRMTRWPGGHRIVPVVLPSKSVEQRLFLKRVVQMSEIDYAQHWIGQIFRGQAAAPPHLESSPPAARRFVAAHPYAIAFISAADLDSGIRVLTIDGKSAEIPGYALTW